MAKYIDVEKLKAEIERRISIKENLAQRPEMSDMKESLYDIIGAYQALKSFITSLQQEQPEVDLEEEMDRFFEEMPIQEHENIFEDTYHMIARHFYELGKNSK